MQDVSAERWLPVAGSPGYEVSDHGRVRSLGRVIMCRDGKPKRCRGQVLKPTVSSDGYLRVRPYPATPQGVHALVLEAFVGPRPTGMQCCHRDGDPANNRVENLRWGTISENQLDRVRHGTHQETAKTHCPRRHRLAAPNLDNYGLARGKRYCLACRRTHALIFNRRAAGIPTPDFQVLSDAYYAEILSGWRLTKRVARDLESGLAASDRQVG